MTTKNKRDKIRYEVMSRQPRRSANTYHAMTLVCAVIGGCLQMTGGTTEMIIGAILALTSLGCAYIAYWEEWFIKETNKRNSENKLRD